ncbi:MAG: GNAT family N-acetyltransferase [Candidatus Saccharimonadales bacterium]
MISWSLGWMVGCIVGVATLNILIGPGVKREGYLEDFVTAPDVRKQGVGDKLWQAMLERCQREGVDFNFTSHPNKEATHRYYLRHGAEVRDTAVFRTHIRRILAKSNPDEV